MSETPHNSFTGHHNMDRSSFYDTGFHPSSFSAPCPYPGHDSDNMDYIWNSMIEDDAWTSQELVFGQGDNIELNFESPSTKKKRKEDVEGSDCVNLSTVPAPPPPLLLSPTSSAHFGVDQIASCDGEAEFVGNLQDKKMEEHSTTSSSESDWDEMQSTQSNFNDLQAESTFHVSKGRKEDNLQEPVCGMEFCSEEEAYTCYLNYAKSIGFNIRKGKVQKSKTGTVTRRYFFCSQEGFRSNKQLNKMPKYRRKETRTGCEAKMQIALQNGKWQVTKFIRGHNHDLTRTSENHSVVHMTNEDEMEKDTGATKNCYVYPVGDNKSSLQPEDVQSLINYFADLQLRDPSIFYTIQLAAIGSIKNIFWRDGRSRIDYDYFGDALIVDTTFRVEKYDMICVPFLGVNHHQQFVLFGCAFLLDRSTDSFSWLLKTFMESMGRHQPKTIFTDEDQLIFEAIKAVLPNVQHRIGKWNIQQNALRQLSMYFTQPDFDTVFNECIFGCQTEDQFEFKWNCLLNRFDLGSHPWLNSLYLSREMWSDTHSVKAFTAGIECFDSIKSIFHCLNSDETGSALTKFIQQYLKAVEQLRTEELHEDLHCNRTSQHMILKNSVEKQAANEYTYVMFKTFQKELLQCMSVAMEETASKGNISTFKLTEEGLIESFVEYNCADSSVTCSCKKWESIGILCVHALKVLNAKNIFCIPPQYIMKRWTKSAKNAVVADDHHDTSDRRQRPKSFLIHKAINVITRSLAIKESMEIVEEYLDVALKRVEDLLKTKSTGHLGSIDVEVHSKCRRVHPSAPDEGKKETSEVATSGNDIGRGACHDLFVSSQVDSGISIRGEDSGRVRRGEWEVDSRRTISRTSDVGENRLIQIKPDISRTQLGFQRTSAAHQNNIKLNYNHNNPVQTKQMKLHPCELEVPFHRTRSRYDSIPKQFNYKLMEKNCDLLRAENMKLKKELQQQTRMANEVLERIGGTSTSRNNSLKTP